LLISASRLFLRLSGKGLVLRLLDKTADILMLSDLGMHDERIKLLNKLIKSPYGIILVTGPTGSGKTTTLYAALSTINRPEINIITIEDPIEYQMDGVGQIQVNPKIDLTFAAGLRSIVRQDPDVILIGEIRRPGKPRKSPFSRADRTSRVFHSAHQRCFQRRDPFDRTWA